jgi:hypothetical protein
MANFGCANNTNTLGAVATVNRFHIVGGNFPGGTITALNVYARDRGGNSAFNDFDFAIYTGGSASGPSGASLLWNSKRYAAVGIGTVGWKSIVDGSNAAPNVAGSAAWLWVMMRSNDGIDIHSVDGATDEGDFTTIGVTRTVDTGGAGTGDNPGDTWPSTFPADNGTTYSDVFKIRLDYTPSGPSGSLLTRQRGMSGGMAELTGGMRG